MARYRQAGEFRVRQREQLRRALQKAADALEWDVLASFRKNPVEEVTVDVRRMTQAGIRAIERELESEIAEKRQEIRQLQRTVKTLSSLADEDESAFPTEVVYHYTSTRGKGVYVTREEELLVEDSESAEKAAAKLEKRLDRLGRLRDEMVESLKQRKKQVGDAKSDVRDFVQLTHPLVNDVLATLY